MNYPLHFGLEKTGLPLIVTTEHPKNICFLIDTGSTENIIFQFVYTHFKDLFPRIEGNQGIMGIDGRMKNAFFVNAELTFDDLHYIASFAILEATDAIHKVYSDTGIQIHGILGIPFLVDNGCIIDFNNLYISSHPEKKNINSEDGVCQEVYS